MCILHQNVGGGFGGGENRCYLAGGKTAAPSKFLHHFVFAAAVWQFGDL